MGIYPVIFLLSLVLLSSLNHYSATNTLTSNQSITINKTLISSGQTFELGLFSPTGSEYYYLGVWYKRFPSTVVWVASRENPLTDSNGILTVNAEGNLVIFNSSKSLVWSSSSPRIVENPVAVLLDSGNFVLGESSEINTWQSFDFPCDTLLPGMKMGYDLKNGLNRYLTSWKNSSDPSPGEFTYRIDSIGLPQFFLREGSVKKLRSGPWNGQRFSGLGVKSNPVFIPRLVMNNDEFYYTYESSNDSIITRLILNHSGLLERVFSSGGSEWALMYTVQNDLCDEYGHCGPNGICRINGRPICDCLDGFIPKSEVEWGVLNWTSGCVRRTVLSCDERARFEKVENVKLPDLLEFWVNKSLSLDECERECLKNCSCIAYANSDVRDGGRGCLVWLGDLIDIRKYTEGDGNQNIYIRMPFSQQDDKPKKWKVVVCVALSMVAGMLALGLLMRCLVLKRRKKRVSEAKKKDIELPFFALNTIATATNNFSRTSIIGEGGFGPVYKGKLSMRQEIAVKRLSKSSEQGLQEFKNEVILISKLQHRNLVRLLGCCIEGEERMLIYEYMPNKSLDYFIFDVDKKGLLTWQKRFDIAMGIARGLLYLHEDSILRIIHRDLKTSNILLDGELNPKISDFGIARIFGADQMEAKTRRVVGTYGYMSPEYAVDGNFSVKSDVFSFGVLLLEIVSGKKNRNFHEPDHHHNLLGHAWLLWNEGEAPELMEACLEGTKNESQILRCIQISLLCVQKLPKDRPTMSSVVFMLGNEGVMLPRPKEPGFFIERSSDDTDVLTGEERSYTGNVLTITLPQAR